MVTLLTGGYDEPNTINIYLPYYGGRRVLKAAAAVSTHSKAISPPTWLLPLKTVQGRP
jgi:hypothetical protein